MFKFMVNRPDIAFLDLLDKVTPVTRDVMNVDKLRVMNSADDDRLAKTITIFLEYWKVLLSVGTAGGSTKSLAA